jgi:hypothetical protein
VVGSGQGLYDLFYSSEGWELSGPRRIAYDGGADSLLQFQFKRGDNGTKCYRKIKRRQRARLGSMARKHNMA